MGAGHPGGRFGELVVLGDGAGDGAVVVLPDAFDQAIDGQGSQDGVDVGGQGRPDGETGAGSPSSPKPSTGGSTPNCAADGICGSRTVR
ncbi:hypothetical protein [Streptomyces sp. NPDC059597]|uniref:hypothetical protein n=1 Tax=Streptomyces sp. NPDC059597 TaxID=3346879 RepID=UPI0036B5F559